jgi:hypothetical protein
MSFKQVINSIIYWGHFLAMGIFTISGFFFSVRAVVFAYLLIELQLVVFNGCFVTKLQREVGSLPTDEDFIPALANRFFKVRITDKQHELIGYGLMVFPVVIAVVRAYHHF